MKNLVIGLVIGIFAGLCLAALAGYITVVNGWVPARADEPSGGFETWAAHSALRAVIKREAPKDCPVPGDEANLAAGAKIYSQNCSGCHGAPGSPKPDFAKGFSPSPPLFASGDSVTDDPVGSIYWKVNHGIRFTGMPAFNSMLKDNELWQVSLFLKNMDKLPPPVDATWKSMK